jgi:hypothetical protein
MLLIKLGILVFLGKKIYTPFLFAHLIHHTTQSIKRKLNKQLEVSSCSQQQV